MSAHNVHDVDALMQPARYLRADQRGISLVELVLFMVIISVALAGIMLVMNQTMAHSADTVLRKQAAAVAESLLEEIEAKNFSGAFSGPYTQANRASFDGVLNYNGFVTSGVFPADGGLIGISGLGQYNVSVSVTPLASTWAGIPSGNTLIITVQVTPPVGSPIEAIGYRTNY
ncbi:MAG: prepilin-type N-terminal cleavage/methylation domain-containing protein [Pseudomonadota bacterium]